jgi:DNA-binding GntR family transcriptional regulator
MIACNGYGLNKLSAYKPLRDEVFLFLKKAILQGHLKSGDRLVEQELAQQMDISRTPIREALRKLELEGLVDYVPRRGVVVVGISAGDAIEIYTICAVLEGLAASLTAKRRSDREVIQLQAMLLGMEKYIRQNNLTKLHALHANFHHYIAKMSQSPRLYQTIVSLRQRVESFREASYSGTDSLQNGWEEHEAIVTAIQKADVEKAEYAARNHLMQVKAKFSKDMLNNKEQSQYEQFPEKELKSVIREHDIIDLVGLGDFRGTWKEQEQ